MENDSAAFIALIARHAGLIRKVAYAYCKTAADRDDVVQDIAVALWRARAKYDPAFRETTWIYRIALNVAISAYRRGRRHVERRDPLDEERILVEPVAIPPEVERLRTAIEALTPIERALVVLYLDDNDHATIADVLGMSPSNVGTRLHRIKEKLRHGAR